MLFRATNWKKKHINLPRLLLARAATPFRIAKQALNGIEPFDVDASYRWEQGLYF